MSKEAKNSKLAYLIREIRTVPLHEIRHFPNLTMDRLQVLTAEMKAIEKAAKVFLPKEK